MNSTEFKNQAWIDILFYNRNKMYGAYTLRRDYATNLKKSMWAVYSATIVVMALLYGFNKANVKTLHKQDAIVKLVDLSQLKPNIKIVEEPKPLPNETKKVKTVADVIPKVVVDNTIKNETKLATVHEKEKFATATKANEGAEISTNTSIYVSDDISTKSNNTSSETKSKEELNPILKDNKVHDYAEVMPEYNGGNKALLQYLANNFKVPAYARENGIAGKIFVEFVINKNGEVEQEKIVRGIGGGCDEEALRVIRSMPKWKAGKQNGKEVNVRFRLPFHVQLT